MQNAANRRCRAFRGLHVYDPVVLGGQASGGNGSKRFRNRLAACKCRGDQAGVGPLYTGNLSTSISALGFPAAFNCTPAPPLEPSSSCRAPPATTSTPAWRVPRKQRSPTSNEATTIRPGETEAGSAGRQPCRGIAWRAHRNDDRQRRNLVLASLDRKTPMP
jgi:hypothetical protein